MDNVRTILQLLAQSRVRLNLILMAAKFLAWFAWTGIVSGAIFLMIHWVGWFSITITIWILVSLSGGLAGLTIGWWRRLDNRAAARWLDEHLHSGEIFSAALVCLEHGCSGCFDSQIIASANTLSDKPNQIKWPVRYLLKQAGLVAGVIILFTVGLIYLAPVFHSDADHAFLKTTVKPTGKQSRRRDERLVVESPRVLAKLLFPEDVRMAMLAERALREGDLPVLQNLLSDAEHNMERQMSKMANPEEERRLKNEAERRQQLMESLIAKSEEENQTDTTLGQEKGYGSSQRDTAEKEKGNQKKGNPLALRRNSHNQSLQNEAEDYNPSDYFSSENLNGGTGHNPNKGNWGTITARTGKEETIISKNKKSQILEYILPGKKARLPLTQVIPNSARTAEAAIYREGIPYEYEEFIRNYFLSLSQETKSADIKEVQK